MIRTLSQPQDFAEALLWVRRAADQGRAAAQFNLGLMYFHGVNCRKANGVGENWMHGVADPFGQVLSASSSQRHKITPVRKPLYRRCFAGGYHSLSQWVDIAALAWRPECCLRYRGSRTQ
jgi:hypothetical protein